MDNRGVRQHLHDLADTQAPVPADTTRALAIHAEEQASAAAVDVSHVRRSVKRLSWVWGALLVLGGAAGAGYALSDRMAHYATQAQLRGVEDSQQRDHDELHALVESVRAQQETQKRMADQIDDIHRYFMRSRK